MINYTPEQEKKIESNLDQIVSYIKKNIQPYIPEDESVYVRFHSDNSRIENRIYVSDSNINGYLGAMQVHFEKGTKKSYCDCIYDYADCMLCFILEWKKIKSQLHKELENKIAARRSIINAIEKFEV